MGKTEEDIGRVTVRHFGAVSAGGEHTLLRVPSGPEEWGVQAYRSPDERDRSSAAHKDPSRGAGSLNGSKGK